MPKYSKTAFQLRSVDGNLRALRGRIDDFIFRTRNGKQKIYIREDKPRRTKPTKGEVAARSSFALMAQEVTRRMANGDKRPRKLIWAEVKAEFKKGDSHAEV